MTAVFFENFLLQLHLLTFLFVLVEKLHLWIVHYTFTVISFHQPDHLFGNRVVPMNGKLTVPLYTDGCEGTVNHVKYLEHVQARITMTSSRRGEIQIFLTSPSLTRSTLLAKRTRDLSREGFNNWAFMTTHNWGEPAKGQWTLEIENGGSQSEYLIHESHCLVYFRHVVSLPSALPDPSGLLHMNMSHIKSMIQRLGGVGQICSSFLQSMSV